jgi:hypothetical protein
MKSKSFFTTKEMVFKLKRPPIEWKKIFSSYSRQGTYNQIMEGAQKTKLPKNQ